MLNHHNKSVQTICDCKNIEILFRKLFPGLYVTHNKEIERINGDQMYISCYRLMKVAFLSNLFRILDQMCSEWILSHEESQLKRDMHRLH